MDNLKHFRPWAPGAPRTVYIAGKITGDPDYRRKFAIAEAGLLTAGYAVMNPAILPDGFLYEEYMAICKLMIEPCKAVYFLPCWKESPGARVEMTWAREGDKTLMGFWE